MARYTSGVYHILDPANRYHIQVVDDYSSKLDLPNNLETVDNIDANHMQIARCRDRSDPQYRFIFRVLERFVRGQTPHGSGNRSQKVLPPASHDVQAEPASEVSGTSSS
jgi:hypothetical protein